MTWLACTPNSTANWAVVLSPRTAAKATLALNAAPNTRRFLLILDTPDPVVPLAGNYTLSGAQFLGSTSESPHSRNDYIWHSTSLDPWIPVAAVIGKVGCNKLRKLWFAIRPHTRLKLLEWLAAAINCSNSSSDVLNESL